MIDRFIGKNAFLSNFHKAKIKVDGKEYATAEHYYQSKKAQTPKIEAVIINANDAMAAARLGRSCNMRADWENIKVEVMRKALLAKFRQHKKLKEKLLETNNEFLMEGNFHGDVFWGVFEGNGRNMLGHLLMELRENLNKEGEIK